MGRGFFLLREMLAEIACAYPIQGGHIKPGGKNLVILHIVCLFAFC